MPRKTYTPPLTPTASAASKGWEDGELTSAGAAAFWGLWGERGGGEGQEGWELVVALAVGVLGGGVSGEQGGEMWMFAMTCF